MVAVLRSPAKKPWVLTISGQIMQVTDTAFPEVKVLSPKKFGDARGFFSEVYNEKTMKAAGINYTFVQDNQSYSAEPFTLRGLHYQTPPFGQTKLVRVLRGAALDIVVDVRKGSPNLGKHITVELRPDLWNQILVPEGFAHGILTTEPHTELFYKVTNYYSPANDRGIIWNDPQLAIKLPCDPSKLILSDKDLKLPLFKDADLPFTYKG